MEVKFPDPGVDLVTFGGEDSNQEDPCLRVALVDGMTFSLQLLHKDMWWEGSTCGEVVDTNIYDDISVGRECFRAGDLSYPGSKD